MKKSKLQELADAIRVLSNEIEGLTKDEETIQKRIDKINGDLIALQQKKMDILTELLDNDALLKAKLDQRASRLSAMSEFCSGILMEDPNER